jgi:hypothetical protein
MKNEKPAFSKTAFTGSRFVPMLMSTPMVKALLNGTKTETRRTQGLEKINENPDLFRYDGFEKDLGYHYFERLNIERKPLEKYEPVKSKTNVGDVIWVRETFGEIISFGLICYKADVCSPDVDKPINGWKPSLFMPKSACRIFLKCNSVKAERLQDIDEQGAINEGILFVDGVSKKLYYNYQTIEYGVNAIDSYMSLWEKINGKDSWEKNPWVWVYKFEVVERPHDFL